MVLLLPVYKFRPCASPIDSFSILDLVVVVPLDSSTISLLHVPSIFNPYEDFRSIMI